jgi:diguanylate cyclase (GGDEF)-like protein/putative nucleotidyltransferase with HDIG domain
MRGPDWCGRPERPRVTVWSMGKLPVLARAYVASIIVLGGVLLAVSTPHMFASPALFFVLLALSSLTSAFKIALQLPGSGSTMSVSYTVDFAALLLLGPADTMLIAAASAWSQCSFRIKERNPPHRTLFSMGSLVVTVFLSGLVYSRLGGVHPPAVGSLRALLDLPLPIIGATAVYYLSNTVLVALAVALSTRQSFVKLWTETFLESAPNYCAGALVAALGALLVNGRYYLLVPLAAAPLYLSYRAGRMYIERIQDERRHDKEISEMYLATIEALALAIDAKDQTTHTHIRRVQIYAVGLARALGMSEKEIQGVTTAAVLHDIGKLAVPEHILSKPGALTPEEFKKIRIHPQVGAEIIEHVPFPYPVAPLILNHHERWDGKGYPRGLKGEEIPLGARILSVADFFDALMTDRPYHRAMSREAAISMLEQDAGKGLDPVLVRRFLEILPDLMPEAKTSEASIRGLRMISQQVAERGAPAAGFMSAATPRERSAFENIALAHREIYALYEIAQALGTSLGVSDTMTLIASKLSKIVPFSCCALFLFEEENDVLRCRFATGIDAELVQGATIKGGYVLAGWVARNRRALVNVRPSADLEAAAMLGAATRLQSALMCPLVFREQLIGTLAVYHTEMDHFTDDHRRLLDHVSEQAAAVIANSITYEQTREDSLSDPLTELPNTRYMFMYLNRELSRAERLGSEVALLVMDLDDFKDINDTYGHHTGDRGLREVARVLRSTIRPYDTCVRYAGDEFVIVLSGCDMEQAEAKRLELQQAVDDLYFEGRPGKQVHLSLSAGAAVFPYDGRTYEDLLSVADNRMYTDKSRRKIGPRTVTPAERQTLPFSDELDEAAGVSPVTASGLT